MKKLLSVLCACLALAACDNDDANTIKIGAILPMTGSNAMFGDALKTGISTAIADKKNTKYTYKVIFEDNQQMAAKSVSAANKLATSNKVNILFSNTTGIGRAIAPVAENANILSINTTLETENTEPMGKTTFFQGPSVESYHKTIVHAVKHNKVKSIAIIAQNVGVSCPGAHVLAKKLNDEKIKTFVECFNPGERDFDSILNKYQNLDAYMVSSFPPESDILLRNLFVRGIEPNRIYGQGIDNGTDLNLYNDVNCIGPTFGTKEFFTRMQQEYKQNNLTLTSAAYDLVSLAIDAFENVGPDDMDAVYEYIRKNASRDCMSGTCKLLPNGFIVNDAEWHTYKEGKPTIIEK